jgi:hexosaminidase
MRSKIIYCSLFLLFVYAGYGMDIVPYPKTLSLTGQNVSFDVTALGIASDTETSALCSVIKNDLYRLTGIKIKDDTKPVIHLSIDAGLKEETYRVQVQPKSIIIQGGSYAAVSMGWVSVLQSAVIEKRRLKLPEMNINDYPDMEYRGLMLDLARNFHSHYVVKQAVDICRWYKIRYLHLHLSDNQSYVFPSAKFPKLLKEGRYYTPEQIQEIAAYAGERGITLIPEIEGPGHSSALRNAYPEIFGQNDYKCIDISSEKVLEAMKILTEEVINAFPSSPYFHIGADETNLNTLKTLPHVVEKIKEKGYNDVHDLYLDYLCEMHRFVKSKGKQTLAWEGFDKDGSDKVKIPKDLIVCAFETMYQRPDSLAGNGYNILNTSWIPLYITSNCRWSLNKIFNWNYYTWEHWNEGAPAAKTPIVLNEKEREHINGAQLCAWELREEMEYPALCKRLGAMSERIWNVAYRSDYEAFEKRILRSEAKLKKIIYPLQITAAGLTEPDYKGVHYNRENYFSEQLALSIQPLLPDMTLHYTTDRSFPTKESPVFPEKLSIRDNTFLKVAMYDAQGTIVSYYPVFFENKPLKVTFQGQNKKTENLPDKYITFDDSLSVNITKIPLSGSIHYTLDGSEPSNTSPIYEKEITVSNLCPLHFRYFDDSGKAAGERYGYLLCPTNQWNESIKRKYRY